MPCAPLGLTALGLNKLSFQIRRAKKLSGKERACASRAMIEHKISEIAGFLVGGLASAGPAAARQRFAVRQAAMSTLILKSRRIRKPASSTLTCRYATFVAAIGSSPAPTGG